MTTRLIKRIGGATFAALTVGFLLLLGRDTVFGYARFGYEGSRLSQMTEAQAEQMNWTDENIESPNGEWTAVLYDYDRIIIQREPPSNADIILEHRDSDLTFRRIVWISDETLGIEGEYPFDHITWLRWDWRRNRIAQDGAFDQMLKGLLVSSIGALIAGVITFVLFRPFEPEA